MLLVLKIVGLVISSFFGVYALLHNYRDSSGRITFQGKFAMSGIALGVIIGAIAMVIEQSQTFRTTKHQLDLLTRQAANTERTLHQMSRAANRVIVDQASVRIDIRSPTLAARILKVVEAAKRRPTADCPALPDVQGLGSNGAIRFSMPTLRDACSDLLAQAVGGRPLPRLNFGVGDDPSVEADAVFRLSLSDRLPVNMETDLWLFVWSGLDHVQMNFDDIPVRFQTENILAIEDFISKELFAVFEDWGFLEDLEDARVAIRWVNLQFQDGRDMRLSLPRPPDEGRKVGPQWEARLSFPTTAEGVTALVDSRMIRPTDDSR